ncbi:MAG: rhodanese-like domain-containing protein [Vicinamibacterales bacterium]
MHRTLITAADLASHLGDPRWVVIDCRFDLANTAAGEEQYVAGHVPRARYAHLDRDLSGPKTGSSGRHPLPTVEEMAARFGAMGIGPETQVVAYDADSGMFAARLWWMLRYMGHDAVAVLDGGLARWVAEGSRAPARPRDAHTRDLRARRAGRLAVDGRPAERRPRRVAR